jgi:hypothetical protein
MVGLFAVNSANYRSKIIGPHPRQKPHAGPFSPNSQRLKYRISRVSVEPRLELGEQLARNGRDVLDAWDYVVAHQWFNLAAATGAKDAKEMRDIVAAKMTSAQIAEAQRLAREWKPKPER